MKYLTSLWGIIILLLACVPCTDGGTAVAPNSGTVVQVGFDLNDTARHNDLCSPLCECSCCGSISLEAKVLRVAAPKQGIPALRTGIYTSSGACSPSFSFWHPPKA